MSKVTLRNQLDLAHETITEHEAVIRGLRMDKRHLEDKVDKSEQTTGAAERRVDAHEKLLRDLKNEIDVVTECIWPGFNPDKPQMMPAMGPTRGEPEIESMHEEAAHRMIRAIYRRCSWGLNPMMGYQVGTEMGIQR